ncbi:hypothetical protein CCAN2_600001 [Capnocytophaga canimorsus]|nr:hypothetical protein CCAN2_600001 [Capnocytophaga canimorsus]
MRFGTLDLVRGDWRNFNYSLSTDMDDPVDDNTYTEINSVNIIENENEYLFRIECLLVYIVSASIPTTLW